MELQLPVKSDIIPTSIRECYYYELQCSPIKISSFHFTCDSFFTIYNLIMFIVTLRSIICAGVRVKIDQFCVRLLIGYHTNEST